MTAPKHAHVLGIGGVGMSGVALLLRDLDVTVSGSDLRESPIIDRVRRAGCSVQLGPDPQSAARADWWIAPAGIPETHPERAAAIRSNTLCLSRDDAAARLLAGRPRVAVIGTHGRAVGAALLAAALGGAAEDIGHLVGALRSDGVAHARVGSLMITELDERSGVPDDLEGLLITELAADSLGYYDDDAAMLDVFRSAQRAHPVHVTPADPFWPEPSRCVYQAWGRGDVATLSGTLDADWQRTSLTLRVDAQQRTLTLPPGPLLAQSVCAAACYAHHLCRVPLALVAQRLEAAAPALVGLFEVHARSPLPALHDVRTYPIALARTLDDVKRLGVERSAVLLRPYPPTFDRYPLRAFVEALSRAGQLLVLPDYFDDESPRAERLVEACRQAGVDAQRVTVERWRDAISRSTIQALIAFGGDDLADALDA